MGDTKKNNKKKKKKNNKEKLRKFFQFISLIAAIGCLGYFAVYCIQSKNKTEETQSLSTLKEYEHNSYINNNATVTLDIVDETPDILEEYQALYVKNKSLIGWIKIDGTSIDYPVMQTRNNDYYLDHGFDQKEDKNGSIFLDMDCSIWPRSTNLLLYGHNMKSGKMFGTLSKYKDKSFFDKHQTFQFDTLYEKGTYKVLYVFSEVVHESTEVTFKYYQFIDANSKEEFDSNMNEMANMSLYDTGNFAEYGDKLITLSTCDYGENAERFAVVAKKIN